MTPKAALKELKKLYPDRSVSVSVDWWDSIQAGRYERYHVFASSNLETQALCGLGDSLEEALEDLKKAPLRPQNFGSTKGGESGGD